MSPGRVWSAFCESLPEKAAENPVRQRWPGESSSVKTLSDLSHQDRKELCFHNEEWQVRLRKFENQPVLTKIMLSTCTIPLSYHLRIEILLQTSPMGVLNRACLVFTSSSVASDGWSSHSVVKKPKQNADTGQTLLPEGPANALLKHHAWGGTHGCHQ